MLSDELTIAKIHCAHPEEEADEKEREKLLLADCIYRDRAFENEEKKGPPRVKAREQGRKEEEKSFIFLRGNEKVCFLSCSESKGQRLWLKDSPSLLVAGEEHQIEFIE